MIHGILFGVGFAISSSIAGLLLRSVGLVGFIESNIVKIQGLEERLIKASKDEQ